MEKQKIVTEWQNIKVEITYNPKKHGPISHVELRADERLPVTETGYRSIFENDDFIAEFENVEAYVKAMLDEAMKSKDWQKYQRDKNQLSLFK